MVNVFGESVGSGSVDLQLVKKVVATVGQYEDYTAENKPKLCGWISTLQTAYKCRWYICTPMYYYDGKVYVLDDVCNDGCYRSTYSRR